MIEFLGLLYLTAPCFQVNIAVDPAYSIQARAIHDGQLTSMIDDPGQHEISTTFCGLGEWIIDTRVAPACQLDCSWDGWQLTLTAHVGTRPGAPELYFAELKQEAP